MKRAALLILIAALFIFLTGCGEDSPVQETEPEIEYFEISGQLFNWHDGPDQYITFYNGENIFRPLDSIAASPIDTAGNFLIKVPRPPQSLLRPIKEIFPPSSDFLEVPMISDSAAKFIQGILVVSKNKKPTWGTYWYSLYPVGMGWDWYQIYYYYFDRNVEINGRLIYSNNSYGSVNYSFTAKSGWNIILEHTLSKVGTTFINNKPIEYNGRYSGFFSLQF